MEHLLPLIYDYPNCSNHADYCAIWDGLLSGTIDDRVAEIVKIPFIDAVERMGEEPAGCGRSAAPRLLMG